MVKIDLFRFQAGQYKEVSSLARELKEVQSTDTRGMVPRSCELGDILESIAAMTSSRSPDVQVRGSLSRTQVPCLGPHICVNDVFEVEQRAHRAGSCFQLRNRIFVA